MKFEISRSLNGDKIIFIARDPLGNVRLRAGTLEDMGKAIEEFNKPREEEKKPEKKKFLFNRLGELIRAKPAP